ncbi:MAG: restriction endonuclease subunit S [Deltaproteobacteria bacterium]|nr:restriction endonuclease subunit S [Deltaproteobacteria bacterium]
MSMQALTDFDSAPFEIIDGDRGKNYPKQHEFSDFGYCMFLSATNVTCNGFDFSQCQFITEQKDNVLRKGKLERDDVVLTTRGTIGNTAFFNSLVSHDQMRINSGMVILRCNREEILPAYLYHFLRSPQFHGQVNSLRSGVAQPQLPIRDMRRIKMPLPKLSVQQRIASILSAYDDLIENNRRRIQLLEESARLLYREWFGRLRFPGHEHIKIIDGVPEGWKKKQVKHVLGNVKRPRKIKKSEFLHDGQIPCVDQSRDFIGGYTEDQKAVIDEGKPIIVFGDHTRILKFVDFPFACGADGTQLIVSHDEALSQEYLYFSLDAVDLSNYFYARHFKFLKDQYIPVPTKSLIATFTATADPVMKQVKTLRELTHKLAKARDLLLPRLMNGEIKV